jgi:hypothetical protein
VTKKTAVLSMMMILMMITSTKSEVGHKNSSALRTRCDPIHTTSFGWMGTMQSLYIIRYCTSGWYAVTIEGIHIVGKTQLYQKLHGDNLSITKYGELFIILYFTILFHLCITHPFATKLYVALETEWWRTSLITFCCPVHPNLPYYFRALRYRKIGEPLI